MQRNVGTLDRVARGAAAAGLGASAFLAPLPLGVKLGVGATALYLLFTAFAGACLCYRLMGRSTCTVER